MSEKTYVSEIYDIFLFKISDYSLISGSLTNEDIQEMLFSYFKSARARFRKCKNVLDTAVDEDNQETYIKSELTYFEMEIIVHLMLAEHSRLQTLSSEVIKQNLSDKDFKIHSQANQLRELNLLYRQFKREARKMITEYTFLPIEESDIQW